jgi:hypothetical protein
MVGTTFDSATTALATDCIAQAEAEVNKYLCRRYDISSSPFQTSTTIPPMVTTLTKWLSLSYMYENLARGSGPQKEVFTRSDRLESRALKNLELISEYKANLLDTAGSIVPDSNSTAYRVLCNTSDYSTTFNEDSELDWEVDSDKLEDIDTERA